MEKYKAPSFGHQSPETMMMNCPHCGHNGLRLLSNDAAHIEAKVYEEIGAEEIRISIEFTVEILKAVYQYESLLKKLRSLKKA